MMKDKLLLALLFILIGLHVQAQNYSPILTNNTSFFESYGIYALHVDSITTDPKGTAHHFIKDWGSFQDVSNGCNSFKSTWAGPKCIVHNNTYYFFNQYMDTIVLKPTGIVGAAWQFYTYANHQYIEATITDKSFESFLSLSDSVKTITLQLKDVDGTPLSSLVNGTKIAVSKNYGLIKFIYLNYFPNSTYAPGFMDIVGMTAPDTGFELPTAQVVFNYAVGDEFHYKIMNVDYNGNGTKTMAIHKVLNVRYSTNTDTVIYTMQRFREIFNVPDNGHSTYVVDTFIEKHQLNQPEFYPGQAILVHSSESFIEQRPYANYIYTKNNPYYSYNGRLVMMPADFPDYDYINNCQSGLVVELFYVITYAPGIGQTHRQFIGSFSPAQDDLDLLYFKKGSEIWGQPLLLSTYSKSSNAQLALFPNPLKQGETLHFSTEHFNVQQIVVYNGTGNKVLESTNNQTSIESIDVSKLQAGLYVVQLLNEKNEYISAKLIIK